MPNQLINETSPYLLQHAHNPVDWLPWNNGALEKAKTQNKPIFLSIGYAACHWCHVMAHESFEDPKIAEIINAHFIPIKVDREERPDLDSIYMVAVVTMTGRGGWPMSMFLTPEGQPFYGGTYFPPSPRHGLPSFQEVLISIAETWKSSQVEIRASAEQLTAHIQQNQAWQTTTSSLTGKLNLKQAAASLISSVDKQNGGWGTAPKFPSPLSLEFLLLQHMNGHETALDVVTHTLREMQKGGINDVVGGGFHRYATDHAWLIPHFEKMLYDNAQLALTYLHAFLVTGDITFKHTCEATLDFIAREMRHSNGGFYSSLDADSEGEEGKFYVWSSEEIHTALSNHPNLQELISLSYPVTPSGNFEGHNILRRKRTIQSIADEIGLTLEETIAQLNKAHILLQKFRSQRIRPQTDDKVLTFWNALALRAFSEAARYLQRQDYLKIAETNASFILKHMRQDGKLMRSWRKGALTQPAFLEDYAGMILALLSIYQSSPNNHWYQNALSLTNEMVDNFQASDGSFYTTRHDQENLILRPREIQDNVTPSSNALAAHVLLVMSLYTGRGDWRQAAETLLNSTQKICLQYPASFAYWLQVLDLSSNTVDQIAVLLPDGTNPPSWLSANLWNTYRPYTLLAQSTFPPTHNSPDLLKFRPLKNNQPTIYFCRGTTCLPEFTTENEFIEQVNP